MKNGMKGVLLVILSACAFGSIGVISRLAIDRGGDETSIMIIRFFLVSLFFLLYMKIRGIGWRVTRRSLTAMLILGLVCYGNVALMFFLAMKYISPSLGSLILYSYPALVMVGSILFLGESFSRYKAAALVVSLAGCAVVLWGPLGRIDYRGVIFAVLTALFYAAYIVGSRKVLFEVPPAVVSAYMAVCCLVFFIFYGFFTGTLKIDPSAVNLATGAVMALWCTIIGFLAFLGGLRMVGAQNAAIISTFEPLYTIVLAFFILGEGITLQQTAGGIIIISGVFLLNIYERSSENRPRRAVIPRR